MSDPYGYDFGGTDEGSHYDLSAYHSLVEYLTRVKETKLMEIIPGTVGRWTDITGFPETAVLTPGVDFRQPRYRRAVFKKFYRFHCKYLAHPGAVYAVMPFLQRTQGWMYEQSLWFAFLNGNTQNPVTSWLLFQACPELPKESTKLVPDKLMAFFNKNWDRLAFDTDRRHWKAKFLESVDAYRDALRGQSQQDWFFERCVAGKPAQSFWNLWDDVRKSFYGFGRLSTFSYLEYIRIMGLPIECDSFFLDDLDGSRSHRNGLCIVLGRDDLDWKEKDQPAPYTRDQHAWLYDEAELLLKECQAEFGNEVPYVDRFTMESALCTYKSWHRPNRRYPGVYLDMFHDRIRWAQARWPEQDFSLMWQSRDYLPDHLRLEKNPCDAGVTPAKQNHYLKTGQPVMMDQEYPDLFRNDYNDNVRVSQGGEF